MPLNHGLRKLMMPSWALPLAWLLFFLAVGTVLAILFAGCQMPLR